MEHLTVGTASYEVTAGVCRTPGATSATIELHGSHLVHEMSTDLGIASADRRGSAPDAH